MYSWKCDLGLELGEKPEIQSKVINKSDWKSEDVTSHILGNPDEFIVCKTIGQEFIMNNPVHHMIFQ